ncbi:MAG: tetratricopeptide repeat protein, partial [Myxococcales bacterium]|nr:tetratricopeptide repeat protein [Myxococcales bacterium]
CDELVERAAATWSPARTAELEARFLALDLPYAADTWRRVREGVSTHVERWAALQRETCEAARVDAEAAPVLAQRQECLDERLREVGVLLEVLDEADPHTVESAAELVASLSELEACLDDEHLRERLVPADPWRRARVQQLRSELDRARMLYEAGRLDAARMELLAQGAAELDYLPFTAELTLLQAETTAEADFDRALELANLAFEQALASRHDEIAFEASAHLGHLYGSNRLERGEAERWIRRAEAMLHRLGDDEHETLTVLNLRAVTLAQTGALSEASEDYQELVERHRRIGERRNLAAVLNNAGNVEFTLGRVDEGLAMLEESLRLSEQEWGPDHPKSLRTAANLGIMMVARGELDEGRRRLEAIVPPQEAALGSDSPELANSLESLAVAYARLDRLELAGTMRRRVLEIREHAYGADSVPALSARGNLAYQLELEGKPEEALRLAKEVVATNEARDEPALRVSLHALVTATDVAVELGRADEAWSLAQRLDQTCAAADPCSPQIHRKSQLLSGMALLLGGKPEAAVPLLEEVVRDPADEGLLPMAQFQLARALASDPARRAEAIALARRAAGPANEGLRKKITAWLAEQGR